MRAALWLLLATGHAITATWDGSTGDWDTPGSWSSGATPGAGDDAVVTAGAVTVSSSAAAQSVSVSGGTLSVGAGATLETESLAWSGGTLSGSGELLLTGASTISVASGSLYSLVVRNTGYLRHSGAHYVRSGMQWANEGVMELAAGASLSDYTNDCSLENRGTLLVPPGATALVASRLNTYPGGLVNVTVGATLQLSHGGDIQGALAIDPAGSVAVTATNNALYLNGTAALTATGGGTWALSAGSATVIGDRCDMSDAVFAKNGGTLYIAGVCQIGRLLWSAGGNIYGSSARETQYLNLTGSGSSLAAGTSSYLRTQARLVIAAGADLELGNGATLDNYDGTDASLDPQPGSTLFVAAGGSAGVYCPVHSQGTVRAEAGATLSIRGGGELEGVVDAAAQDAAVVVTGTDQTLYVDGARFPGPGVFRVSGGSNTQLLGGTQFLNGTFEVTGGYATVTGPVTAVSFSLLGGYISGLGATAADSAYLELTGTSVWSGSTHNVNGAVVINRGRLVHSATHYMRAKARIINYGLWELHSTSYIDDYDGDDNVLVNYGELRAVAGSSPTVLTELHTTGLVNVSAGAALSLNAGGDVQADVLVRGTLRVPSTENTLYFNSTRFSGAGGTVELTGGAPLLSGEPVFDSELLLRLAGSTAYIRGVVTVGTFEWASGNLYGWSDWAFPLHITSHMYVTAGSKYVRTATRLIVDPDAVLELEGGAYLDDYDGQSNVLEVLGTLLHNTSTYAAHMMRLELFGVLHVGPGGYLGVVAGGDLRGHLQLDAGATLLVPSTENALLFNGTTSAGGGDLVLSAGAPQFFGAGTTVLERLTLAGASLYVNAPATVGDFVWTSGNMYGGHELTLTGTGSGVSGGTRYVRSSVHIVVADGAVFTVAADSTMADYDGQDNRLLVRRGGTVVGGGLYTWLGLDPGAVLAGGVLTKGGDLQGTVTGDVTVGSTDSTLYLNGTTGSTIAVTGGTDTRFINAVNVSSVSLAGGSATVDGEPLVDTFDWSSGNLFYSGEGWLTVLGGGTWAGSTRYLYAPVVVAGGVVTLDDDLAMRASTALITVGRDGVFAFASGADMYVYSGTPDGLVVSGELRFAGSPYVRVSVTLLEGSLATLEAGASAAWVAGDVTLSGASVAVAADAALRLSTSGSISLNASTLVGSVELSNGPTGVLGDVTASELLLSGSDVTVAAGATLTVVDELEWDDDVIAGDGLLVTQGEARVVGGVTLRVARWRNEGWLSLEDQMVTDGASQIVNVGTLELGAGTLATQETTPTVALVNNSGIVVVNHTSTSVLSRDVLNAGGSVFVVSGAVEVDGFLQVAGETVVDGELRSSGFIRVAGGELRGNGSCAADVVADGSAVVVPGAWEWGGTLAVDGDYTQTATATFVTVNTGVLASEYGSLIATGTATLAGALVVADVFQLPTTLSFKAVRGEAGVSGLFDSVSPFGYFIEAAQSSVVVGFARSENATFDVIVDASGAGSDVQACGDVELPCGSIQFAAEIYVGSNYTIRLEKGTYNLSGNGVEWPGELLIAGEGPEHTVIDCEGSGTGFSFAGAGTLVGVTIQNCDTGVRVSGGWPALEDVAIRACALGMEVLAGGAPVLVGVDNSAGLYMSGADASAEGWVNVSTSGGAALNGSSLAVAGFGFEGGLDVSAGGLVSLTSGGWVDVLAVSGTVVAVEDGAVGSATVSAFGELEWLRVVVVGDVSVETEASLEATDCNMTAATLSVQDSAAATITRGRQGPVVVSSLAHLRVAGASWTGVDSAPALSVVEGATAQVNDSSMVDCRGGALQVESGASVTLRRVTVNGTAGGAARVNAASLLVVDSLLSGNAARGAGVVLAEDDSDVVFEGCRLLGNEATFGDGGVAVVDSSTLTLRGTEVRGNAAAFGRGGVASVVTGVLAVLDGSVVANNSAQTGGLCLMQNSELVVVDSSLVGNEATAQSGSLAKGFSSVLTLLRSVVADNRAQDSGAIFGLDLSVNLTASIVERNVAGQFGALAHLIDSSLTLQGVKARENAAGRGGVVYAANSAVRCSGSTLEANWAEERGGAVFVDGQLGSVVLESTWASANVAPEGGAVFADEGAVAVSGSAVNDLYAAGSSVELVDSSVSVVTLLDGAEAVLSGVLVDGGLSVVGGASVSSSGGRFMGAWVSDGGALASRDDVWADGDGVLVDDGGRLSVENGTFRGNSVGVEADGAASLLVNASLFEGNVGGGGIRIEGVADTAVLSDVVLRGNEAEFGAGVSLSEATLVRLELRDNVASVAGGGVFWTGTGDGVIPTCQDCLFSGNSGGRYGDDWASGTYSGVVVGETVDLPASGAYFDGWVAVAGLDAWGQLVRPGEGSATARSEDATVLGVIEVPLSAVDGVANFSSLGLQASPGSNASVVFDIASATPVKVEVQMAGCAPGTADLGGGLCQRCNAGSAGAGCELCAAGYFQAAEGQAACDKCPAGTYTDVTGQSECRACDGYTVAAEDQAATVPTQCSACPVGARCEGGLLYYAADYWRGDSGEFYACPKPGRCLGGQTCAEGYEGPLCSVCADDYTSSFGMCVPCQLHGGAAWGVTLAAGALFVVLVLCMMRFSKRLAQSGGFKVLLSLMQMLAAILAMNAPWPALALQVMSVVQLSNLSVLDAAGPACLPVGGSDSYFVRWGFAILALPLMVLLAKLHVRFFSSRVDEQQFRRKSLLMVLVLYPGVSATTLMFFNCVEVEGVAYLASDFNIRCYEGAWTALAAPAALFALLYPFGIPLACGRLLYRLRRQLETEELKMSFGVLYRALRAEWYLHDVVVMGNKMVLWAIAVFASDGTATQLLAAALVQLVALAYHAWAHPYTSAVRNVFELLSFFVTVVVCVSGLVLKLAEADEVPAWEIESLQRLCDAVVVAGLVALGPSVFLKRLERERERRKTVASSAEAKAPGTGVEMVVVQHNPMMMATGGGQQSQALAAFGGGTPIKKKRKKKKAAAQS